MVENWKENLYFCFSLLVSFLPRKSIKNGLNQTNIFFVRCNRVFVVTEHRRTLLYARDRDHIVCLAYNEFAFKKAKEVNKLEDSLYKRG